MSTLVDSESLSSLSDYFLKGCCSRKTGLFTGGTLGSASTHIVCNIAQIMVARGIIGQFLSQCFYTVTSAIRVRGAEKRS